MPPPKTLTRLRPPPTPRCFQFYPRPFCIPIRYLTCMQLTQLRRGNSSGRLNITKGYPKFHVPRLSPLERVTLHLTPKLDLTMTMSMSCLLAKRNNKQCHDGVYRETIYVRRIISTARKIKKYRVKTRPSGSEHLKQKGNLKVHIPATPQAWSPLHRLQGPSKLQNR